MWEFTDGASPSPWRRVESPVSVSLQDVAVSANGPCAVGNTGTVVARAADGTWGTIVENGPSARGEALHAVDVTADGERVWFCGANGALGCYEVAAGSRFDRSEPQGVTDSFGTLAVAGSRGAEKLLLADGSGHVFAATVSGSSLDWEGTYRPAGDTAVTALDATPAGVGYATDPNANVYRTTKAEGFTRLGVDDAQNSFYAIAATSNHVFVGGGNGRVYRLATDGGSWTPADLGNFTVQALATADSQTIAAGTAGTLCTRRGGWKRDDWSGSKTVNGVAPGDVAVAVGNDGLILERSG